MKNNKFFSELAELIKKSKITKKEIMDTLCTGECFGLCNMSYSDDGTCKCKLEDFFDKFSIN